MIVGNGLPDEVISVVAWAELDHFAAADHLTSVWIPRLGVPVANEIAALTEMMRTLREKCPWDVEQTHHSLRRYVIEEAYELVDAIDGLERLDGPVADADAALDHFVDELGDVLFQVVFHAAIGAEEGSFTLADVARRLGEKLRYRHPHVFARADFAVTGEVSASDVRRNWEAIKAAERATAGAAGATVPADPFAGVASGLPSLTYASKVLKRAGDPVAPAAAVTDEAALGDALLALVASARHLGLDPETVLRTASGRVRASYRPPST